MLESAGRVPSNISGGATPAGPRGLREASSIPAKENLTRLGLRGAPLRIVAYNVVSTSPITAGVLASLYAGYLNPELRVTANNMSPVINGPSTILLFVYIDPHLSIMTDDVVGGRATDAEFRRFVTLPVISRLAGTLLAQLLLLPGARVIVFVARHL